MNPKPEIPQKFARGASESAHPGLWEGLIMPEDDDARTIPVTANKPYADSVLVVSGPITFTCHKETEHKMKLVNLSKLRLQLLLMLENDADDPEEIFQNTINLAKGAVAEIEELQIMYGNPLAPVPKGTIYSKGL